jgi:leucyl-tRNA synthetase
VWRLWNELRPYHVANWRESLPALTARDNVEGDQNSPTWGEDERKLRRKLHQTIRKVTEDIENYRFNTCVAALMEFTNELSHFRNALGGNAPSPSQAVVLSEIIETLPLLLSPITPHMADELWERLGNNGFTFKQPWPHVDEEAAAEDAITIVVQVNGKLRDKLRVPVGTSEAVIKEQALSNARVQSELNGKQIRKVIAVAGKLVNIVIG